jgi:integrase
MTELRRRCAWIHSDQAKGRKTIAVPLSAAAILVLREQIGKHPEYVFCYREKPVKKLNTKAWRRAPGRAGIEDFRWHDLRHYAEPRIIPSCTVQVLWYREVLWPSWIWDSA